MSNPVLFAELNSLCEISAGDLGERNVVMLDVDRERCLCPVLNSDCFNFNSFHISSSSYKKIVLLHVDCIEAFAIPHLSHLHNASFYPLADFW